MCDRYLLVISPSEGIQCIGQLPHVGDEILVEKEYADAPDHRACERKTYRVKRVLHTMIVRDIPYDSKGARGNPYDNLPEVYVEAA